MTGPKFLKSLFVPTLCQISGIPSALAWKCWLKNRLKLPERTKDLKTAGRIQWCLALSLSFSCKGCTLPCSVTWSGVWSRFLMFWLKIWAGHPKGAAGSKIYLKLKVCSTKQGFLLKVLSVRVWGGIEGLVWDLAPAGKQLGSDPFWGSCIFIFFGSGRTVVMSSVHGSRKEGISLVSGMEIKLGLVKGYNDHWAHFNKINRLCF